MCNKLIRFHTTIKRTVQINQLELKGVGRSGSSVHSRNSVALRITSFLYKKYI